MCGIAGIYQFNGTPITTEDMRHLEAMGHRLRYRGPDDYASHQVDTRIAMQFRRLSIVDLQNGMQPFVSDDGQVTVMVNGEIYNHQSLRKEVLNGVSFRSNSDCEVVLALYLKEGMRFLSKLNGMFAISIYDNRHQRLILARDRLGIKPLFYCPVPNGHLLFASEIKALAAHPQCPREFDWIAALSQLELHMDIYSENLNGFLKGVEMIPAGSYIVFKQGSMTEHQWWSLEYPSLEEDISNTKSAQQLMEEYHALLQDSVALRLMSDVQVGIALSGGIDSVAIAALSAPIKSLETFTVLCNSTYINGDSVAAHQASQHLKLNNHQLYFPWQNDIFTSQDIDRILYDLEMPINLEHVYKYMLYKKAKETFPNLKTLLMGQGSDEFNGGYCKQYISNHAKIAGFAKIAGLKDPSWDAFQIAMTKIQVNFLIDSTQPKLKKHAHILNPDILCNDRDKNNYDPWEFYFRMYHRSVTAYNLWHEDRTTSANQLENRVPFLDHRIVEFCSKVPPSRRSKLFFDKMILRKPLEKMLPDSLVYREKCPFFIGKGTRYSSRMAFHLLSQQSNSFIKEALFDNPGANEIFDMKELLKWYQKIPKDPNFTGALEIFDLCCVSKLAKSFKEGMPEPERLKQSKLSWFDFKNYDSNRLKVSQEMSGTDIDENMVLAYCDNCNALSSITNPENLVICLDRKLEYIFEYDEKPQFISFMKHVDGKKSIKDICTTLELRFDAILADIADLIEYKVIEKI
jgi:asparagine synthase (glutamine-hydrolysing)